MLTQNKFENPFTVFMSKRSRIEHKGKKEKETPCARITQPDGYRCVLILLIYGGQEQNGKGWESGDKGMGSERARNRKWRF